MGCDGGTIPKRDELVKTKKKEAQTAKDVKAAAKWNNCHLSQLPLQKPIVADLLGNLYNKECLIEYLLDKSKYESGPEHVKTLKDVKELDLLINPSSNLTDEAAGAGYLNRALFICPITGLEMNGMFKFFFLYSCGCAFSERAYKSIQSTSLKCIKCEKPYNNYDLIVLNPISDDDADSNKEKMKLRKEALAKAKAEKSSKKDNNKTTTLTTSETSNDKKAKEIKTTPTTSGHSNSNSSLKRSNDSLNNQPTNSKATSNGLANAKKVKSVQEDPNTSEVYKSLFNTCDKAKNQQKAHWVTFNPQYF